MIYKKVHVYTTTHKMVGRSEHKSNNNGPNLIRISSIQNLSLFLQASHSSHLVNIEFTG